MIQILIKDNTFTLSGILFKVPLPLAGFTIKLLYDPHTPLLIPRVFHEGIYQSTARPVDVYANTKVRRSVINHGHASQKIHPVLILDEAHLLSHDILQEIRLLTNFEIDSVNALTVLLCGQESLLLAFGLSMLESLAGSITINIQLDSLPLEETFAYIQTRISDCGNSSPLFTKAALTLIHQASGGLFRSIGIIAWSALHKAFLTHSSQVEAEHVKAVIER